MQLSLYRHLKIQAAYFQVSICSFFLKIKVRGQARKKNELIRLEGEAINDLIVSFVLLPSFLYAILFSYEIFIGFRLDDTDSH